jgi:hypothetical protein
MATTTPNYGWTVPTSTDLVKDGATAIETLGDAIDASMNTALGTKKAGMVLLNTTSFSAVASQALPASTFSSTYDEYKIFLSISACTSDAALFIKMRASGVDSSTNYNYANLSLTTGGTASNGVSAGATLGQFILRLDSGRTDAFFTDFTLSKPFLATPTTFVGTAVGSTDLGVVEGGTVIGCHTTATSYDSINIVPNGGNISGIIKVYGVNK